ncbi:DUF3137 domain-containing protein [Anaerorhabdus sp.]|uniref:DUF3137 domain-containing protein n=1 Tax=Anaerorhabdus sp. TaxID=1872524 RepID=UPI002B1F5758|nr:DUF3137 domain-containing protein [Anaerorhabdus sp.]MEA4875745.1 DUF3137 domain-containing protein [Anaerorhabdus sp.]
MNNRVNEIEKVRNNAKNTIILLIIIFAIGIVAYAWMQNFYTVIVLVVVLLFLISIGSKKTANYRYAFRDFNLRYPAELAFKKEVDIDWTGMDLLKVEESHVVPFANLFSSENMVTIELDDIKIERSDVITQLKYTLDGRNALIRTLFNGRYDIMYFPNDLANYISIRDTNISGTDLEKYYKEAPATTKVLTEDNDFNKLFDVYTVIESDVEKILTDEVRTILKNYKTYHTGVVYFGFLNNEIHLAVSQVETTKESSVYKSVEKLDFSEEKKDYENMIDLARYFNGHETK